MIPRPKATVVRGIELCQRWGHPVQQHGRRMPLRILSRPTSMQRFLVSSFLADVTQHIHSLRASGVMLTHKSVTIASDSIALRKSPGIPGTVPEAIGCRAIVPSSLQVINRSANSGSGIPPGRRGIPVSRNPEGGLLTLT